jgi:Ser/Thr protein kinase RdoA (MazF antagonist)
VTTSVDSSQSVSVQRSIVSAEALAPIIAQAYALDGVSCQLIKSGMVDTYAISAATGPAILPIYPAQRRTELEIRAELDLLVYLHTAGIAVSVPIPQCNGERLFVIQAPEGTRYVALFTYAPGQPLSQQLTPPNAHVFGHMLGRMHQAVDQLPEMPLRPRLDLENVLDRSLAALDRVFRQRIAEWQFLRQVADMVRPRIATLPAELPAYGVCHGDVGSANAHITADGQITLFDFDLCGIGWRAYDIGAFLIDEPQAIAEAFLKGYQSVRVLSAAEQATITLLQIVQSIWVLGLRAEYVNEWGTAALSERLVNNVRTFIRQTIERERL